MTGNVKYDAPGLRLKGVVGCSTMSMINFRHQNHSRRLEEQLMDLRADKISDVPGERAAVEKQIVNIEALLPVARQLERVLVAIQTLELKMSGTRRR